MYLGYIVSKRKIAPEPKGFRGFSVIVGERRLCIVKKEKTQNGIPLLSAAFWKPGAGPAPE